MTQSTARPHQRRARGRPRKGESNARDRILLAATEEFGEHGYDGTTTRGIAARAGVDPALLHHHFGTKADLFASSIGAPMRPDLAVPEILTGPREHTGERLVAYVLGVWESPALGTRVVALMRTALGSKHATPLMAGFLRRELLGKVAATLDVPDADLRADLVAAQVAGLLVARYLLRLPELADAPVDDLVVRVGATVQHYLFD
ncbi:MAG TPA: TetR family transcriptional regulator [Candidatus Nanopelagicales bacterium]|nr:TetR family transcriptional regulator [Candidatus Nanopelagicales bacterium]